MLRQSRRTTDRDVLQGNFHGSDHRGLARSSAPKIGTQALFSINRKEDGEHRQGWAASKLERDDEGVADGANADEGDRKIDLRRGGFATARKNFRDAQIEVRSLAREMSNTKEPSREMERAFKRAQQNVAAASRAYESQKNVLIGNKRAIEGMGINVGSAATHQARLRFVVERTNQALLAQGRAQMFWAARRCDWRRVATLAAGGAWRTHCVKTSRRRRATYR
jgi:hypothetical protein